VCISGLMQRGRFGRNTGSCGYDDGIDAQSLAQCLEAWSTCMNR
jgi:hypothetical protein